MYLRCINAYFNWLHREHGKELIKIPRLKEEQKILATFSPEQIKRLVQFKPPGIRREARVHVMAICAIDTGVAPG